MLSGLDLLQLSAELLLDAGETEVFRSAWGESTKARAVHSFPIGDPSEGFRVRCVFSLVDAANDPDLSDEDRTEYSLSVSYLVEMRRAPSTKPDRDSWDRFASAMRLIGRQPVDVEMRLRIVGPSESLINLPISLSASDFPGFSQIRGIQLAQVSDDDPSETLYSVVIQNYNDGLSTVTSAPALAILDNTALASAFERASDILRLAIPGLDA